MTVLVSGFIGSLTVTFAIAYGVDVYGRKGTFSDASWPALLGIGFITNFIAALGIGSSAPTTSFFKIFPLVEDRVIPGTLNVGDTFARCCPNPYFHNCCRSHPLYIHTSAIMAKSAFVLKKGS